MNELVEQINKEPTYSVTLFPTPYLPAKYRPYIYSKWLRSLRFGNPLYKKVKSDEYYKQYKLFIEKLMAKPGSYTKLALLTEDPDIILGFSIAREDVLDYIYVHTDYRRHKIGTALFPLGITAFTHLTQTAMSVLRNNKYKELNFNPFA